MRIQRDWRPTVDLFADAEGRDCGLGRRLAALDQLLERRPFAEERERVRAIEAELTELVRAAGSVRTDALTYTVGPDGRLKRTLPT